MSDSQNNNPETPITANTETEATLPKMQLNIVPNWSKIFFTWSFFFHVSSIILTLVDQILPFMGLLQTTMDSQTYAITMFTLNGLGILSRFVKQKKLWKYDPNNYDTSDEVQVHRNSADSRGYIGDNINVQPNN